MLYQRGRDRWCASYEESLRPTSMGMSKSLLPWILIRLDFVTALSRDSVYFLKFRRKHICKYNVCHEIVYNTIILCTVTCVGAGSVFQLREAAHFGKDSVHFIRSNRM